MHDRWAGLAVLSLLLLNPFAIAELAGKLGEMDRLEQQADDLAIQADAEGAALAIGKAAMMADLLARESQNLTTGNMYQAASFLFRAQELGFRALALFERTGGTPPAPVGVCQFLDQGNKKLTHSNGLLGDSPSRSSDGITVRLRMLHQKNEEWKDLLQGLHEDFGCDDITKQ